MAYASASDVVALCNDLLGQRENTFSDSTCPTLTEVNAFLSSGCGVIETFLSANGYSTPVASTTSLYGWVKDINAYYAAAMAEFSRLTVTVEPRSRTKAQLYEELFWKNLDNMLSTDLAMTGGISRSSVGSIYVGGISIDEKNSYIDDSDRVKPRFSRDLFAFPGIQRPSEPGTDDD